jgi:hypothetical protein
MSNITMNVSKKIVRGLIFDPLFVCLWPQYQTLTHKRERSGVAGFINASLWHRAS